MRRPALHLKEALCLCLPLFAAAALLALSACSSISGAGASGLVMVVDTHGKPVQGAILVPEEEYTATTTHGYSDKELKELASDAKGMISFYLEDCLWESDGCYHFHIHRAGYEDVAMSVSKDLFPPVLRIEMIARAPK